MDRIRKFGDFKWDNYILTVNPTYIVYQGRIYFISWINDLCFYHSQGNDYWYYIWNGELYHCIKYKSGYGFKEIHQI